MTAQRIKPSEKQLRKEGWAKQNTIGEPRLTECIELYKSLGFEVHLEPVTIDELNDECRRCYEREYKIGSVKTIYIRPKKGFSR